MIICRVKSHIKLILLVAIILYGPIIVHAQNSNVRVSIKRNSLTIKEAFHEIKKQTGMSVAYNQSKLNDSQSILLDMNDKPLSEVLAAILKDTEFSYELKGDQIMIVSQQVAKTKKDVRGKVTEDGGDAIIGASVAIKGKKIGTQTDVDGNFSLPVEEGDILVFTYLGYSTKEVRIGTESIIDIQLAVDSKTLETVIVTALGIKRSEKALSYNAEVIGQEAVNTVKDASFINSLTGKVAGLNINSSSSGMGGASKVVLRGQKSVEGNNNVLYVVDGIPMLNTIGASTDDREGPYGMQPTGGDGIGDINPDDIENMTVLKGPAASALYGSSAANGAIIITTKKGVAGKPKITYTNQTTFSDPFTMPKFQNGYANRSGEFASWGDLMTERGSYDPKYFFNTGTNIQNTLSLSLGSEKNQTYISMSTTNADGIVPNNEYNRYNFSARNTTKFLNDKMTLDFGASYVTQDNQNMTAQGEYFNPLVATYLYPRGEDVYNMQFYKEYNTGRLVDMPRWNWGAQGMSMQNPYWTVNENLFNTKRKRYTFNAGLTYKVLDWLSASGRIKVDNTDNTETIKLYAGTLEQLSGKNGNYGRNVSTQKQTYADFMMSANKNFGEDFSLNAHVGTIFEDHRFELTGLRGNLSLPNFFATRNIALGHDKTRSKEEHWVEQTHSIFASADLGWKNMLYLTVTGRNEWSSTLARMPKKSFFYPSVGVSGVISEMVQLPEFFNFMKVRASYADVGSAIPRNVSMFYYDYMESEGKWNPKNQMPIDKLYPEKTSSWEVGFDTRFWQNRFNIDVTFYKSNTKKQTLTSIKPSSTSSYGSMVVQTGDIENKGMELSLGYNQKFGDFDVSSNFSASINLNKIKDLGRYTELGETIDIDYLNPMNVGSIKYILHEGGTVGDIWASNRIGRDENGYVHVVDGKITTENHLEKIGSVLPRWNFGLNNTVSWKDIHLGFVLTARTGGKVVSFTQSYMDAFGVSETTAIARDNGGVQVNNGTIDAESWYRTASNVHSGYVYNASNIRLQELSVGYTLPQQWFDNKFKVTTSFVGRNLWMIYCKAPFDPESVASTGNFYQGMDYFMMPSLRNLGFSVKVEF